MYMTNAQASEMTTPNFIAPNITHSMSNDFGRTNHAI